MTEQIAESSSRLLAQALAASSSLSNHNGLTTASSLARATIEIRYADHSTSISPYRKNLYEDACKAFPGLSSHAAVSIASCRGCERYVGLGSWRRHEIKDQSAHLQPGSGPAQIYGRETPVQHLLDVELSVGVAARYHGDGQPVLNDYRSPPCRLAQL